MLPTRAESRGMERKNGAGAEVWNTACYLRLSREDGDKTESDSIANQRKLLEQYISGRSDLILVEFYQDDGYTGTNFDRPAFRRMEEDLKQGKVNCVLVKDLSRFGRDYIEMGRYLEREFPAWGVRFIAVNDHVDSLRGRYDMMLPLKNLFNTQYARDISEKVRSSLRAKQQRGEFIGGFASYGYRKDPRNRNHLVVDLPAAQVVRQVFNLFEQGAGQVEIARRFNREGIPSPSQYKRDMGERYTNGRQLPQTAYWTYATVHRMLQNRMYAGDMEQGRYASAVMGGKVRKRDRKDWIVVRDTHEAIIPREQWERVQRLLAVRRKEPDFHRNTSPFAGFLRCGDCGRAMVKSCRGAGVYYSCGSYKRYGAGICTKHSISHRALEEIVLEDLNRLIASVERKAELAHQVPSPQKQNVPRERKRIQAALDRVCRLKKAAYEDYREHLLDREDYLRYRGDYEGQERELKEQMERLKDLEGGEPSTSLWVEELLQQGKLTQLDQITVAETIKTIQIFEDGHLEITYTFSNEEGLVEE